MIFPAVTIAKKIDKPTTKQKKNTDPSSFSAILGLLPN